MLSIALRDRDRERKKRNNGREKRKSKRLIEKTEGVSVDVYCLAGAITPPHVIARIKQFSPLIDAVCVASRKISFRCETFAPT